MFRWPNCGRRRISDSRNCQARIDRFRRARRDSSLAVLEGFHPLKHAHRFGGTILETVTVDAAELARLTRSLAPDLAGVLEKGATVTPPRVFQRLAPVPPATGVIAIAQRPDQRPEVALPALLRRPGPAPVVLLENPRRHGNIGAAIRVAAAVGAVGLVASGEHDPWHPAALVGAAGLHFALPVVWAGKLRFGKEAESKSEGGVFRGGRSLVAVDPAGEALRPGLIPDRALLAFGSEREGISPGLLAAADGHIALPMQPGVSSLNLATAVAAVLYAWRLAQPNPAGSFPAPGSRTPPHVPGSPGG